MLWPTGKEGWGERERERKRERERALCKAMLILEPKSAYPREREGASLRMGICLCSF